MDGIVRFVQKWDPYHGKYRPYALPEGALKCSVGESRMDKVIACAGCGKPVEFEDTYTSLEIHTEIGLGLSVCSRCHAGEIERAKDAEEMQQEEAR